MKLALGVGAILFSAATLVQPARAIGGNLTFDSAAAKVTIVHVKHPPAGGCPKKSHGPCDTFSVRIPFTWADQDDLTLDFTTGTIDIALGNSGLCQNGGPDSVWESLLPAIQASITQSTKKITAKFKGVIDGVDIDDTLVKASLKLHINFHSDGTGVLKVSGTANLGDLTTSPIGFAVLNADQGAPDADDSGFVENGDFNCATVAAAIKSK